MAESPFLFQSKSDMRNLFVVIASNYETAHLRAQKTLGPDILSYGRFTTIETQAQLCGNKMKLRSMGELAYASIK